jgi:hypothetical protein
VKQRGVSQEEKKERRDNEVGAPENRIELALSLILTPRLETSNTGTWIDRHRSRPLYLRKRRWQPPSQGVVYCEMEVQSSTPAPPRGQPAWVAAFGCVLEARTSYRTNQQVVHTEFTTLSGSSAYKSA